MERIDNTYKVELKKNLKLHTIPFAIWIMLYIIPMSIAILYVSHTLKLQSIATTANINSILTKESLKLQNDLKPVNFLNRALECNKLVLSYNSWLNTKDTAMFYKHPLLRHAPRYNSISQKSILKLAKHIKSLIGIDPSFIISFSSKKDECDFLFNKPFKLNTDKRTLIKSIQESYALLKTKNTFFNTKDADINTLPDLISFKHLGVKGTLFSYDLFNRKRFSSITNSTIQLITIPILSKNMKIKYIFMGIDMNKLNPYFILKKSLTKYQNSNTCVKFGHSKKDTPHYYKNSSNISLLAALPLELKSLLSNYKPSQSGSDAVIKLSVDASKSITSLQLLFINLKRLFFPLALLTLLIIRYNFSQQKKIIGNTLKQSIFIGMYFSALIPIIFASFFWLLHSKIEENNKNSRVMEFMDLKVKEIDIRMNNSRNRHLMYTNNRAMELSHPTIASFTAEKLDLSAVNMRDFLLNYDIINCFTSENVEYAIPKNYIKTSKIVKGINSVIKGILIKMKFFNLLNRNQIKKLQLQYDTSITAISEFMPIEKIASLLKNLGGFAQKLFDTSKTRSIGHLLSLYGSNKFSVFLMFVAEGHIIDHEFRQQFVMNEMDKVFSKYDFDIRFFIYITDSTNTSKLSKNHIPFTGKESIRFKHKAISLYANQKYIRQINLDDKAEPNIVFARPIANNEYFAIGYATPKDKQSSSQFLQFMIASIIISLLSSLFIAWAVTNMLLQPIPPTLQAISELNKNNFAWEIQVNSGDELSLLHKSFNSLSLIMLERNKMQQLVSEDIAEMISIGSLQSNEEAKSLYATVLFSDIRGFTTISEKYNAEEVVSMLNEYFTKMVSIIKKHDGKINQLIGDAIQAVFYDDQKLSSAERATVAAKEMRRELKKLNDVRAKKDLYIIKNGIGLSTGDIITGIVGSKSGRLDSTIIGDTVLLAEELEGFSKYAYKSCILIDQPTANLIKNKHSIADFNTNKVDVDIKIFEIANIT